MRSYTYKKVDAFTSGQSLGNPAAFLDLGHDALSDREMLSIAKEHRGFVSEVVFLSRTGDGTIRLTYYSSECEVAFCGHGTIAAMYETIKSDGALLGRDELEIETNRKGPLTVYNRIGSDDAVYITAPSPVRLENPGTNVELAEALRIDPGMISRELPVDGIDAGLRTLIVPIKKLEDEVSICPEIRRLESFCISRDIDIVLIFSMETDGKDYTAHTRVFAPRFGYLEDPATGSGNSAFGYYLIGNRLWDGGPIKIEQGGDGIAFNEIRLLRKGDRVLFGGRGTKKIEGTYYFG